MKKVNAYTLVEVLVTLVLSSIIVALAVSVYFQLNRANNRIIRDYNTNEEILQLNYVLSNDFNQYPQIEYSIYELNFLDKDRKCTYEFSSYGILRKFQEKTDTFKLEFTDLDYQLQNGNTGMVTYFSFTVKWHKQLLPFSFYKEYHNQEKVNNVIFKP